MGNKLQKVLIIIDDERGLPSHLVLAVGQSNDLIVAFAA
jgi:hypothetical protein